MGRRNLLSADERVRLFDIPVGRDALARCYSFEPGDLALIERRREDRNRLGFAVQLALVRQPGLTLGQILAQPGIDLTPFVDFIAEQLKLPASEFDGYAAREQTMTDHAGDVAKALGLRSATRADLVLMIDAAAIAAWATDQGEVIATAVVGALRGAAILLPSPSTIERAGIAGRARARKRSYEALLAGLDPDQIANLDGLVAIDPTTESTRLTGLRSIPTAPKPDNVRAILAKLAVVREIGIPPGAETSVHPDRLRGLAREGRLSPTYLIERYTVTRRGATVVALLIDLEARLIDAALGMADRLIGQAFTRGKNAQARSFSTSARDVGRLMLMFRGTIDALSEATKAKRDPMKALDEAVGWAKLLQVREQLTEIAAAADPDPLVRAADRHASFRKFLPFWRRSS